MPIIIHAEEMKTERQGDSWSETTLADEGTIGQPAIVARRWSLAPNGRSPGMVHGEAEQLLYVIRGNGAAMVGSERMPLEPETMLWLEPGDAYHFEAGPEGLEILQGYPPEG